MFVLGIVVGVAVGMAVAYLLSTTGNWPAWSKVAASAALVVLLAILPITRLEVRLGLASGTVLGLLLWVTPIPSSAGTAIDPRRIPPHTSSDRDARAGETGAP
jgi:uncharacterized membrane protein YGL010W